MGFYKKVFKADELSAVIVDVVCSQFGIRGCDVVCLIRDRASTNTKAVRLLKQVYLLNVCMYTN